MEVVLLLTDKEEGIPRKTAPNGDWESLMASLAICPQRVLTMQQRPKGRRRCAENIPAEPQKNENQNRRLSVDLGLSPAKPTTWLAFGFSLDQPGKGYPQQDTSTSHTNNGKMAANEETKDPRPKTCFQSLAVFIH